MYTNRINRIFLFALLTTSVLGAITIFAQTGTTTPSGDGNPGSTPRVIALGDSLTVGIGASTSATNWVSLLALRSTVPITNAGVSGDTTGDALLRLSSDVISKNPDIVFVFLGGNDVLQRIPRAESFQNIKTIVTNIQATGAKVILIGGHRDIFNLDWESGYQTIASETGASYVPSVLSGILGNPLRLSDPVHPNDSGYALIADRLWETYKASLESVKPTHPVSASCESDVTAISTNRSVVWKAYVWGGSTPRSYTYEWSGSESLSGSGASVSKTYTTQGVKNASITVRNGNETKVASCRTNVSVTTEEIAGRCEVMTTLTTTTVGTTTVPAVQIQWSAYAQGGVGNFSYQWSGSDLSGASGSPLTRTYTTPGEKIANVQINSADRTISLTCRSVLTPPMFERGSTTPLVGSCSVSPGNGSIQNPITWQVTTSGGATTTTYAWSGEGLTSTSSQARVTYTTAGVKTGTVIVQSGNERAELSCQVRLTDSPVQGGGGCFIATAAYGSALEPDVEMLRAFRDEYLLTTAPGRAFVDMYYTVSPPIADLIRENEGAKMVTRALLAPIVWGVRVVEE